MRVRLHIDVEIGDDELVTLSEQLTEQPVALVELPKPFGLLGGRAMSARAVELAPAENTMGGAT